MRRSYFVILAFAILACSKQKPVAVDETPANDTLTRFNPTLPKQPNIVWLVAEDLSSYLPSFGDSTIATPNISRLAEEGVRYSNVFSPSGVCAPSRCALITGMYPSSIGGHNMRTQYVKAHMDSLGLILYEIVPPPDVRMMSEVMRSNGYYCTNNDKQDYQFAPTVTGWDESSSYAHWRNCPEGKPFFAVFNFDITHESQVFRPSSKKNFRYLENFPDTTRTWSGNIDSADWKLYVPKDLHVNVPPYLPSTPPVINDIRRVYSNIAVLDKEIGIILKQLEDDGLLENTIVVFYTDHGGPLPRQKRLMYDSGIKVPMIIRYPGEEGAGLVDDQLISFVDFAPTTFSFAGINPPSYLQGQAFAGSYRAEKERKFIYAAADRLDDQVDMIRAVRDKRYKYLRNFKPDQGYYLPVTFREQMASMKELLRMRDEGTLNDVQMQWFRETKPKEELFDTWTDPHEIHNLADNPAYADKLTELRDACNKWMQDIHDLGEIPEAKLIDRFWPGWKQPVTDAPVVKDSAGFITIHCDTPGASLGYQVINKDARPSNHWNVYTKPFRAGKDQVVYAIADRIGYKPSKQVKVD